MDVSISYKKDGGGTGKMGGKSGQESVDLDTKNVDKVIKHDCASHVLHKEWGEGQCIPGQHTLVEKDEVECKECNGTGKIKGEICEHCNGKGTHTEGYVTHYDVMFESGIQENVPVKDLEIIKENHHGHMKKKKSVKEAVDLDAKNVEVMLRHDCASHVRHGEWWRVGGQVGGVEVACGVDAAEG